MAEKEVTVQFYPYDIDYAQDGTVFLYGKTTKGKQICVKDDSIKPYFWVLSDSKEIETKIKNIKIQKGSHTIKILKTEIQKKSYLDKPVTAIKITYDRPSDISEIKDKIREMNLEKKEADIPFSKRYLIEKNIFPSQLCEAKGKEILGESLPTLEGEVKPLESSILEKPRVLAFDIEVYGLIGEAEKVTKDPIISVSLYGEKIKKVITWKKPKKPASYLEVVKNEEELIREFIRTVKSYQPDYIVGYFSDGFDFPYLRGRAEHHDIQLDLGLDESVVKIRRTEISTTAKITGIPHIDVLRFIRSIMSQSLKLDSYSLDVVAKEFLSEGKKEFDISEMNSIWDQERDLDSIFEYNLKDSELTYRIFEKILPNLNELVRTVGMPIYEISRMTYGQLVENYLIKRAKEFNEICPNRPKFDSIQERRTETYEGAFVMEPKPGLYENIAFFDFRSLYPSIIISKNISPGTLNQSRGNKTPDIQEDKHTKHYFFDNSKPAFIPNVLRDILLTRAKLKEQLKKDKSNSILKARSYALKTIGNASYGYLGFFGARWYSKECAESITAWARDYIQKVISKAEKEFRQVIASDTDSVAVTLGNKTRTQAMEFMDKINKDLPDMMELELEDFYPRGIFVSKKGESKGGAKKKYALIDDEHKFKIVGFETVRRDWSLIARSTQKHVIETILKEGKPENALKYAQKVIKEIYSKKADLKEMVIQTQLKMSLEEYRSIGPHVAVARKMEKKGFAVGPGTQVPFIVTSGKGSIAQKSEIPSDAKDYDPDYYTNNQLLPSIEKIFEVFGITKEDILLKEKKNQSKLGDF